MRNRWPHFGHDDGGHIMDLFSGILSMHTPAKLPMSAPSIPADRMKNHSGRMLISSYMTLSYHIVKGAQASKALYYVMFMC